ncbi:MAG: phosphatase PAP2 family protein, partial [Candidatus Omnitrophica bacterium]|nr:phosphatase PAP2 family protein [Candidatus Omnitrophota bacterium]
EVYPDISVIGTEHSPAFPSTHATLIAVIATILCFKYKKLSFVLIPIAIIVGVSRIYLGLHYPSDVAGGFIIGGLLSMLFLGIEVLIKNLKDL